MGVAGWISPNVPLLTYPNQSFAEPARCGVRSAGLERSRKWISIADSKCRWIIFAGRWSRPRNSQPEDRCQSHKPCAHNDGTVSLAELERYALPAWAITAGAFRNRFFMARSGVQRIPAQLFLRYP